MYLFIIVSVDYFNVLKLTINWNTGFFVVRELCKKIRMC